MKVWTHAAPLHVGFPEVFLPSTAQVWLSKKAVLKKDTNLKWEQEISPQNNPIPMLSPFFQVIVIFPSSPTSPSPLFVC